MKTQTIDGEMLVKMFRYGAKNLEINKRIVDELNVFPVPDGDTGTNMSLTFNHSVSEFDKIEILNVYSVAKTASSGALIGARGNSGVILSQLLRGFAEGCKGQDYLDVGLLGNAIKLAADVAYKAVMKPTEGTILTVAREMGEFAMAKINDYDGLETYLLDVINHGKATLQKTPEMLPVLKEAGVVDAGGQGLICIVEGALKALINEELGVEIEINSGSLDKFVDDSYMKAEDITFGYCTEFIIKNALEVNDDELREYFNTLGDCVLVIKDDEIVKVHLHTDHPGLALERAGSLGSLTRLKIDNMREQFEDKGTKTETIPKPYGFIAVSPGDGLTKLFKDLGVTQVISGGQTMNPSTQDFLNEVDQLNAETIFIFPNNSNIIMAAKQASEISDKQVIVIPSKSIPQCIASMLAFSPEAQAAENREAMTAAIENVATGEVTYAVRDTKINGLKIKKSDVIGITNGEIKFTGKSIQKVTRDLLTSMVNEDSELISIYYGKDTPKEEANALADELTEVFEDCDVEIHYGGQPLYYYIVSVE
ncbi:DAK2 domain-containing protein [Acetobacterium paludosum]|uniref:DAK2 domain-containing protein n=1 Tax=Acetobacterium paludosum TaxID=52693 RepID=A0A923I203_9FIRM|nr:DAK2 domain-containing protein [Acetobacterium paludosum]MBC3887625.1 DAK2 domain-containing protein [Acetobacterium paludosum]